METDLWSAFVKEASDPSDDGTQEIPKLAGSELVNINRIVDTAVLIPDLENDNRRSFLKLLQKKHWADIFADWVDAEHERNFEEPQGT